MRGGRTPFGLLLNFEFLLSFPSRAPFAVPGHDHAEQGIGFFSCVLAKPAVVTGLSQISGKPIHSQSPAFGLRRHVVVCWANILPQPI